VVAWYTVTVIVLQLGVCGFAISAGARLARIFSRATTAESLPGVVGTFHGFHHAVRLLSLRFDTDMQYAGFKPAYCVQVVRSWLQVFGASMICLIIHLGQSQCSSQRNVN
jgi:hypothetical protein